MLKYNLCLLYLKELTHLTPGTAYKKSPYNRVHNYGAWSSRITVVLWRKKSHTAPIISNLTPVNQMEEISFLGTLVVCQPKHLGSAGPFCRYYCFLFKKLTSAVLPSCPPQRDRWKLRHLSMPEPARPRAPPYKMAGHLRRLLCGAELSPHLSACFLPVRDEIFFLAPKFIHLTKIAFPSLLCLL